MKNITITTVLFFLFASITLFGQQRIELSEDWGKCIGTVIMTKLLQ